MNNEKSCCECSKSAALVAGVLGSCLVVAGLVCLMQNLTAPPAPGQARVEERLKNLTEIKTAGGDAAGSYGVQDAAHNIYRVPLEVAEKWVQEEWKNPANGRSNLIARLEKSTAPIKNPFE